MNFPFNPFSDRGLRVLYTFPVNTLYVTTDTTATTVTYGICPKIWRRLPCDGFMLLNMANTVPAGTAGTYLVNIDTSLTLSQASTTTTTSTSARALLNGSGDQVTNADITAGNRYLIYFNKNTGVFQIVNYIV